jgi:hypothetical protein
MADAKAIETTDPLPTATQGSWQNSAQWSALDVHQCRQGIHAYAVAVQVFN